MKDKVEKLFSDIKDLMLEVDDCVNISERIATYHSPERIVILMLRAMMEVPELWDYMSRRVLKFNPVGAMAIKDMPWSFITMNRRSLTDMMDDMRKIAEDNRKAIEEGILRHDDTRS